MAVAGVFRERVLHHTIYASSSSISLPPCVTGTHKAAMQKVPAVRQQSLGYASQEPPLLVGPQYRRLPALPQSQAKDG